MQLRSRGIIILLGMTSIVFTLLYSVHIATAYTAPRWKWVYIPTCGENETKIGIRSYITPLPYPGTMNNQLIIEFLNPDNAQYNITLHVYLPLGWLPRTTNRTITLMHGVTELVIPGLYVPEDTRPGEYQLGIVVERVCSQGSAWRTLYVPVTVYPKPFQRIRLVNASWSDGYAYPGLHGETLVVKLRNEGPFTIVSYTATIHLPEGMYVSGTNLTSYTIRRTGIEIRPGDLLELRIPVDIATSMVPGTETVQLTLNSTIEYNGALLQESFLININAKISRIPLLSYKVIEKGWVTGAAFPGEKGAEMVLRVINMDKFTATNAYVTIRLPKGMTINNKSVQTIVLSNIAIGYGNVLNIQARVNINNDLEPGTYYATINALLYGNEPSGARGLRRIEIKVPLLVLPKTSIDLRLISIEWSDHYAYPGEINAELSILLRSMTKATISNLVFNLSIPALNVTRIITPNQRLGFGDLLRINTRLTIPTSIKPENYQVIISVSGIVNLDNQEYIGFTNILSKLAIRKPPNDSIKILGTRWESIVIGNESFAARPQVLIEYWGKDRIRSLIIMVTNVTNAKLRGDVTSEVVTYNTILEPGTTEWINLPMLNITDAEKPVSLRLSIIAIATTPSGGTYNLSITRKIELPVALEKDVLRIASIEYVTKHLLPGARNAEIALRIANTAPEPIYILGIKPLVHGINASIAQNSCTTPLPPGQACTLTLSLSIPNSTKPGKYKLSLIIWYSYQRDNTVRTSYQLLTTNISIEDIEKYEPSILVQAYWSPAPGAEPIPVLPGDTAPLQLVIYNMGPTDVKGLYVVLNAKNIGRVRSISQPCSLIPAGSSCTITAYLEINKNLSPGTYPLGVNVSYIFNDYTVYKVIRKQYSISVRVNSDSDAIRIVYPYWLTPPRPGTRSAELALYIVADPRLVEKISSLSITLPRALFNPENNTTTVIAMPASSMLTNTQMSQLRRIGTQVLQSIMPKALTLTSPQIYIAKVGIRKHVEGVYRAEVAIYWVDHLGVLRESTYTVNLPIIGGTPYIEVHLPATAWLKGGIANLSISLTNTGNAPIYNVYVSLIPASYTAYPSRSTIYIPEMMPNHIYNITYRLNYNPASFGQQSSYTFSGILAILYETPTGLHQFFNTTISVVLRPAIELELGSLKASWRNGSLVIEGVIANIGVEQAKTVSIRVIAANASTTTLIGDIDAGSEAPFRVVMQAPFTKSVKLELIYHDAYGANYSIVKTLSVAKEEAKMSIKTSAKRGGLLGTLKAITIVLVLAAVLSVLYLYKRTRQSSIESEAA